MVNGYWLVVRGSWFVVRSSWLVVRSLWLFVGARCLVRKYDVSHTALCPNVSPVQVRRLGRDMSHLYKTVL